MHWKLLPRRVTQREVAQRANVSQSTVSLILGDCGQPPFPAETLERVFNAAKELGYTPNVLVQALKTSRTMTLACVNPYYPALFSGVQAAAELGGYDVIVLNTLFSEDRERHFLQWGMQGRVDGIIGEIFTMRAADFAPLVSDGVGVLQIDACERRSRRLPVDSLFVDSFAAASAATHYLIQRGHQRISMITGFGGPQKQRVDGYKHVMSEAGFESDVAVHRSFDESGGAAAARALLSRTRRPTAIQTANDVMAIGAITAAREAGLRVPDDIAVMGFDDIPTARHLSPSLSTVNTFQNRLGQMAAQMMLERLNELPDNAAARCRKISFEVVPRGSA